MERWRELAHRTSNPMYAWAALEQRLWRALPGDADTNVSGDVTIPAWVAVYLRHTASQLGYLSAGLDPRVERSAEPPVGAPFATSEEYMNSPEFLADLKRRTIGLDEAMKLVPLVLGLTRAGWNAFASLKSTTDKMQQYRMAEALRAQGMTAQDATEAVKEASGARNDRSVEKRIAQGRRLTKSKTSKPTR